MFVPRSYYFDSDYSPGVASQWSYGGIIPTPKTRLTSRLQMLRNMPSTAGQETIDNPVSSSNFQKFLLLQQNPDALGLAQMKMPNTPFGNMTSFLGYGSADQ